MMPISSGASRPATASCASRPKPGMAKTLSMTTLPPSIVADCRPSMVTSGSSALRATWRSDDAPARKPLGARGEREILAPGLGHAGAHHAQEEREIDEAERCDRQHQMPGDVERARNPSLPEAIVSMPAVGNQRSCTAKTTLSTRPSQKLGTA